MDKSLGYGRRFRRFRYLQGECLQERVARRLPHVD